MISARVVVNRRARHLAKRGALLAELSRPRRGIEIIETNSIDELESCAREAVSRARDMSRPRDTVFVFAGGDGSYMAGVSALARAFGDEPLPPIAFAPGGTVGTVARNWSPGWTRDPVRVAARLLDAIASGSTSTARRPTLRVRVLDDGRRKERVGFIFGAGLVARFFEVYDARGAGGNMAAARIVARVFAGSFIGSRFARSVLTPAPCTIEVDGVRAPFDHVSLLCASVVRDLGLGMRLLYRAGEELERFHVVATPLGPRALGPQMPLVLAGRPLLGRNVDALAKTLSLRFPEARGAYVLDGDLFRADAIEVEAGPVLDVVTP